MGKPPAKASKLVVAKQPLSKQPARPQPTPPAGPPPAKRALEPNGPLAKRPRADVVGSVRANGLFRRALARHIALGAQRK